MCHAVNLMFSHYHILHITDAQEHICSLRFVLLNASTNFTLAFAHVKALYRQLSCPLTGFSYHKWKRITFKHKILPHFILIFLLWLLDLYRFYCQTLKISPARMQTLMDISFGCKRCHSGIKPKLHLHVQLHIQSLASWSHLAKTHHLTVKCGKTEPETFPNSQILWASLALLLKWTRSGAL